MGLVLLLALYIPSRFKTKSAVSDSGYADKFSHSLRVLKDIKEQMLAHEESESRAHAQSFDSRYAFGVATTAPTSTSKTKRRDSAMPYASKRAPSKTGATTSLRKGVQKKPQRRNSPASTKNVSAPSRWVKVSGTVVNTTEHTPKYTPRYTPSEKARAFAKLPQVQEKARATGEFESAKVLVKNFDPTSRTSSAAYKSLFAAELGEAARLVRRLDAELEYVSNSTKRYKQANR